jgi:hypothetical protein
MSSSENEDVLWVPIVPPYSPLDWTAHPIMHVTDDFVFVSRNVLGSGEWNPGGTCRLDRGWLEQDGLAYASTGPFEWYYTAAGKARFEEEDRPRGIVRERLGAQRRATLSRDGGLDFEEVEPGIVKLKCGEIYAHDYRQETCHTCQGTGQQGGQMCDGCGGEGREFSGDRFFRERQAALGWKDSVSWHGSTDLNAIRADVVCGFLRPEENVLHVFGVNDFRFLVESAPLDG